MPRILRTTAVRNGSPRRVFLAVPVYGALPAVFVQSLWTSQSTLVAAGIEPDLEIHVGHAHVDDARNVLLRDFLETDCTDLVFIDADVGWQANDLVRLLGYDRDMVGGVYPLKQDADGFPVRSLPDAVEADGEGLVEVEGVAAGFLRMRRHVVATLAAQARQFRNLNDGPERLNIPIVFERVVADKVRYSGDFALCLKWRATGGRVFVAPDMCLEHVGEHGWTGTLGDYWRRHSAVG